MEMLQMHSDTKEESSLKNNLLLLKCQCGHEILLLPDLKTMGKAIEEHAMDHKNKYALTQKEADAIQDNLIAQAFKLASADIQVRLSHKNKGNKKHMNPED